jgi:glycosyltransferase involved in cell wall biosynthesis
MKIGIDARSIGKQRTGDEVYTTELLKNLSQIDEKNTYNLYFNSEPRDFWKIPRQNNFSFKTVLPPQKIFWTFFSLPKFIRKNPVDLLHVQYIVPLFLLPPKTKIITTIHDISFEFFPRFIKKSDLFFLKTLIPKSLKKAAHIITVSETSKKDIVEKYQIDPQKITVIYNGVDPIFFQRKNPEILEKIRRKFNLPKKFILYLGTFQPRKNLPALIKAFHHLKKNYHFPDLKLVLVGNKKAHNLDPKIEKTIQALDLKKEIYFPGFIKEEYKPAIFQLASLFSFPSLYEGFGLPVLEAMASQTPVIASDKSALPEIIKDSGLIINPADTLEFSQSLFKLLTNSNFRKEKIEKGVQRAKFFTWEKCARETLALYQKIYLEK